MIGRRGVDDDDDEDDSSVPNAGRGKDSAAFPGYAHKREHKQRGAQGHITFKIVAIGVCGY